MTANVAPERRTTGFTNQTYALASVGLTPELAGDKQTHSFSNRW
jgi:hypothetical protein